MPKNQRNVKLSYWEYSVLLREYDLVVAGSGIVGVFTALAFKKTHKNARILILEKGHLPLGASTKNAGFACFGSISELSADLLTNKGAVWETVSMRWEGLLLLRKTLGDKNIDYQNSGGYEVFTNEDELAFYSDKIDFMNRQIKSITGKNNCYSIQNTKVAQFGLKKIKGMLFNRLEGQLNTGKMMERLLQLARQNNIEILNGMEITGFKDLGSTVEIDTDFGLFKAKKLVVATNGFAKRLLKIKQVEPARAQVLITEPIKNLKLKGAFHMEQGYYYFRNIDNRVLLGGGRNLDLIGENTDAFALTKKIQNKLDSLLSEMILPKQNYRVEHRWAGIMGVGNEKKPIIQNISPNVVAAVRMGGMGVAIGSIVGKKAADLL